MTCSVIGSPWSTGDSLAGASGRFFTQQPRQACSESSAGSESSLSQPTLTGPQQPFGRDLVLKQELARDL